MKIDIVFNESVGKGIGFDRAISIKPKNASSKEITELSVVKCTNEKEIRTAAENKHIDIVTGLEGIELKDSLHGRNSGLNEVICKLLKKNSIAVCFSFKLALTSQNKAIILGRMMQNVELCRKYKVQMAIASFAETKWEVRSANELASFGIVIGMTPKEAKDAMEAIGKIIEAKKGKMLPQGVRVL